LENKHFTHVTMHRFAAGCVRSWGTKGQGVRVCYLGSKQKVLCPSLMNGLWASGAAGGSLSLLWETNKNHQSHCSSNQAERAGEPLYMWVCLPLGLTLLLLRCSLGSSRSSGRLRLRVGWIHTTLLSHEGGPTGGSLSSWSSEKSSSVSTAQRTVR